MKPILIRCPTTQQLVQHLVEASPDTSRKDNEFETFQCPSCQRIHLVSKAGKLLGE